MAPPESQWTEVDSEGLPIRRPTSHVHHRSVIGGEQVAAGVEEELEHGVVVTHIHHAEMVVLGIRRRACDDLDERNGPLSISDSDGERFEQRLDAYIPLG